MRAKILSIVLLVSLVCGAFLCARPTIPGAKPAASERGFSIVSLQPDAAEALKAKGVAFKYPFPNSANKGKKFNPVGDTVPPLVTASEQKVLVLFVDFDTPPPGGPDTPMSLTYFDDLLFGTTYDPPEYQGYAGYPKDRTLYNYLKEISYGKVSVVPVQGNRPSDLGWIQTGHPYTYYCNYDNGFGYYPNNAQGLVVDAVKAVDDRVDFSQYAVDGVVPNLFVVFRGTGAEWSGAWDLIWSHSWDLSEGTGLNGGLAVDGVKVNNYAMMPEVGGDLTGYTGVVSGPFPPTVGVFAHEYGHVLGLPDQYDYGYESEGTGNFSLMAGGDWNRYPVDRIFSGNSPAHPDAWSKYRLGFAKIVEITSPQQISLPPAETNPVVYKMVVPSSGGKEYFLFENRQNIGFDQGLLYRYYGPDGKLTAMPMHGLAAYHIDETVLTHDGGINYWRPNEAENWKEFRSEGWQKAWTGETHYAFSLLQADDRWDLEHGVNRGDAGDLYPGTSGKHNLTSYTTPNTSSYYFWSGSDPKFGYSGVTVNNIQEVQVTTKKSAETRVTADLSFVR